MSAGQGQYWDSQGGGGASPEVQALVALDKRVTANEAKLASGVGAPTIAGALGDQYRRTDTPTVPNQRLYVCTVAGAAGVATWVGIA